MVNCSVGKFTMFFTMFTLFLLLYPGIHTALITNIYNETSYEDDYLQTEQKYEESARHMWDLTSRMKHGVSSNETQQTGVEASSLEKVELITWFPWFEKKPQNFHTIRAIATLRNENSSKLLPALGVGSWHEITLFGKKEEMSSSEEPDAKALCTNSAMNLSSSFIQISAVVVYLICLLIS